MKYIYSTSQMLKLSLTLYTFSVISSVAGLFLTTSTEAELFAIRYSINQAVCLPIISRIIIITNSIYAAKRIFDSLLYPFQIHISLISSELRKFFTKDCNNSIEFWDCPSCYKWALHDIVDKETKKFHLVPNYLCKSLWDFSRKNKCNNILNS